MLGVAYIGCAFVALGLTSPLDLAVQLHYDALPDPIWLGAIAASQTHAIIITITITITGVSGVGVGLRQSFRCQHLRN